MAKLLKKYFHGDSYYLLENVTIQIGKGTTQIDHILVSEYGVFIIETKNYTGWIFGNKYDKRWTQVIYKNKYNFQNPLHQNYHHIQSLKQHFDFLPDNIFKSIIVFTDKSTFKTRLPNNVLHLSDLRNYLYCFHKKIISANRVYFIADKLEAIRKKESKKTDREHVNYLKSKHKTKKNPVL